MLWFAHTALPVPKSSHPSAPLKPCSSQKCSLNTQATGTASILSPVSLCPEYELFRVPPQNVPSSNEGIIRLCQFISLHLLVRKLRPRREKRLVQDPTAGQHWGQPQCLTHEALIHSLMECLTHSMTSLVHLEAQQDQEPHGCWTMFSNKWMNNGAGEAYPLGYGYQFCEH